MFTTFLVYLLANATLALYLAYRRPPRNLDDYPLFFVIVSLFLEIPAALLALWDDWRRS